MKKEPSNTERSGFFLIEAILATAVFALLVTVVAGSLVYGREAVALAGDRARATMLAEEGLEAARNIRDSHYSDLLIGTHGLAVVGGEWQLSGSSDATGIFTRELSVLEDGPDRKIVSSIVTWQQNLQRTGNVTAITYLNAWRVGAGDPVTSCNTHAVSEGYDSGICRASAQQCTNNGEDNLPGGAVFCTGPGENVCCGYPSMQ